MASINSMLAAATLKKSYKVGVFGPVAVITDHKHKTFRFTFGSEEAAIEAATKLTQKQGGYFGEIDRKEMEKKASKSCLRKNLLAAGLIVAA